MHVERTWTHLSIQRNSAAAQRTRPSAIGCIYILKRHTPPPSSSLHVHKPMKENLKFHGVSLTLTLKGDSAIL